MKRYLLLILALILLIPLVFAAITVTLNSQTVVNNTVTFSCSAQSTAGNLTSIKLYHDGIGTFALNKTNSTASQNTNDTTVIFVVENFPNGTFKWNCLASNGSTSEDKFASSNNSVTVTYTGETTTPSSANVDFLQNITNYNWSEDTSLSNAFDLDTHFNGTSLMYSVSGNTSVIITIASDNQVSFSALGNWSGTETITFSATSGTYSNTSNTVLLNVSAVNDAPYYSMIPEINWSLNVNKTINLLTYFDDVENDTLTFTAPNATNITVRISGEEVTFYPDKGWYGTRAITFTANDSKTTTQSNSVTLRVIGSANDTNTPPLITSYAPTSSSTIMKNNQAKTFSLSAVDIDGDNLTYSWYLNNEIVSSATKSVYTLSKPSLGNHSLKASVSDGNYSVVHTWSISVVTALAAPKPVTIQKEKKKTAPKPVKAAPVCGDGIKDSTENCASCPRDVKCASGEVCQNKVCVKKADSSIAIIIFVIVTIVIAIVGFLVYKFTTVKPRATTKNNVRFGTGAGPTVKEQPAAEIRDFYHKTDEELRSAKEKPKVEVKKVIAPPNETPVQGYVRKMKEKGFSDKVIRKRLKSKGWNDKQIDAIL